MPMFGEAPHPKPTVEDSLEPGRTDDGADAIMIETSVTGRRQLESHQRLSNCWSDDRTKSLTTFQRD